MLGSAALLLPLAEPVGQRTGAVTRTLLAMAATAMAIPAQAQTTCAVPDFGERRDIWTGTVTVGESNLLDGYGYSNFFNSVIGDLSNKNFDIGVNSYVISQAFLFNNSGIDQENNRTLGFILTSNNLTAAELAALKLHVCDTAYDFSDATHDENHYNYGWQVSFDWSSESTRTLYLSLPANNAATGLPTISGTAEFGETLTAATSGIMDADGLPTSFQYQWLRENQDGTSQEPIAGATSNTYTLGLEDVGKKVKVRVNFTDMLNGMEEVTSAAYPATGTVSGPGVSVDAASVSADEGETLTYTMTLYTQPTGNVTITPTSDDSGAVSLSPTNVTFTTTNWDTAQTVSVTAVQDADGADEMVTISHGITGYGAVSVAAAVTVTVDDDEVLGVSVTPPASSSLNEGETFTYTVELDTEPTGNVTITPTSDDSGALAVSTASLTFTTTNWDTAQTVSVAAREDVDATDEMVGITHDVSGADYGSIAVDSIDVAVTDNDTRGVTLSTTSLSIDEGSGTVTYSVVLRTQPTNEVTITPSRSGDGDVTVSDALTFSTTNWNTPQNVTVSAAEDHDADNDTATISHTVFGADYGSVTVDAVVTITVTDDDEREVVVSGSPLTINEGDTGVYTVVLTSAPTGEVTITPSLSGSPDATVSPTTSVLTFTALNWNTAQTVTVTTSQDEDSDDDTATITHAVAGADYGANNVTAESVEVTISEIVLPSVTIAAGPSPVIEGTAAEFILTRTGAATTEELMVGVSVTQNGNLISGTAPPSVTFRAGSETTTLSVSTDDDNVDEDAGTVTVMVAMDRAAPATYLLGDSASATATVTMDDNDPTPVVTLLLSESTIAEAAGMSEVRAMLSGPSAVETRVTVSVPADLLDAVELDVNPPVLVIPAGMTDSANAVTLTAMDNDVEASEDLSVTVSGMRSNTVGVTGPAPVTLTITDDDDTTVPRVESIERQTPDASPTNANSLTWRITFSETVANVDAADFMVSGSTATVSNVAPVSGAPLAYDVTVSGGDLASFNGMVTLGFAGGQNIQDENGNALNLTTPTRADNTYEVDNRLPTVEINVPPTSSAPFTATISFNEMVSGFTVDDIMVSGNNAILSAFAESTTTPGRLWTVQVTPTADGLVMLNIAAGMATDAAGNGNTAATQVRSIYSAPAMETEAKEEAKVVLEDVVLPEVIQQLTAETTEVITSRLNTIASGSPLGTPLTLSLDEVVADTVAFFHGERKYLKNGSLDWRQALSGREFFLPLSSLNLAQRESASAQDNPFSTLALWGGGNYSSYRNIIETTDIDGNGFSAVIGMDLQPISRLTAGLALTTNRWGLDYATNTNTTSEEGTYKIGVTMLNPYMNWLATEQLSLWATVGYGRGEVEQIPKEGDGATRTAGLTSWAGGVRFEVVPDMDPLTGQGSSFGLAFKGDGATSSFLGTQVQLARLAAELSRSFSTGNGLLSTALELGWNIRSVSGKNNPDPLQERIADKNHSGGTELATSLNWLNADGSVSATVDTRVLLGGGDRKEWGMGGQLRFTPSQRDGEGEGLTVSLQPSFGVTGTRLNELWSLSGDGELAINDDPPGARLDAQLAYSFRHHGVLFTPYTELTWEEATTTCGAGLRYDLNTSLELDLKGVRRNPASGHPENRLSLDLHAAI